MSDAPERPTFTVERIAGFERMLEFAAAVLGRPLTAEELARQRARWRERFPETPPDDAAIRK